jgi:hypothetical protein
MSSWPPTLVDWGVLTPRLRDGDPVCLVQGLVDADTGEIGIPICPHCHQAVTIAHYREGVLHHFTEPAPARCMGAERHRLVGNRVSVGWTSCGYYATPGPGGHGTGAVPRLHRPRPRPRRRRAALAPASPRVTRGSSYPIARFAASCCHCWRMSGRSAAAAPAARRVCPPVSFTHISRSRFAPPAGHPCASTQACTAFGSSW